MWFTTFNDSTTFLLRSCFFFEFRLFVFAERSDAWPCDRVWLPARTSASNSGHLTRQGRKLNQRFFVTIIWYHLYSLAFIHFFKGSQEYSATMSSIFCFDFTSLFEKGTCLGRWDCDFVMPRRVVVLAQEKLSCLIWVWVKFVGTSWKDVTNKKPSYHVCRSEAAQIGVEAKVARAEVRAAKAAKAAQAASVGAAAAKAAARAGAKVDDAALPVAEVAGQPFAAWCGLSDLWFHILIFIYRKTIAKPVPGGVASILPTVYTDTRGASPFNPCSMDF